MPYLKEINFATNKLTEPSEDWYFEDTQEIDDDLNDCNVHNNKPESKLEIENRIKREIDKKSFDDLNVNELMYLIEEWYLENNEITKREIKGTLMEKYNISKKS